jgi:hypothetical protein
MSLPDAARSRIAEELARRAAELDATDPIAAAALRRVRAEYVDGVTAADSTSGGRASSRPPLPFEENELRAMWGDR